MPFLFLDLKDKIKGVIFGLLGSIIASVSVALGVSVLTSRHWSILLAGLIVGLASSYANSFGPLISESSSISKQIYSRTNFIQATASLVLTFITVTLPLISYVVISDLNIARIISVITGLVLVFIFGVHQAQLENESPLFYATITTFIGATIITACYIAVVYIAK